LGTKFQIGLASTQPAVATTSANVVNTVLRTLGLPSAFISAYNSGYGIVQNWGNGMVSAGNKALTAVTNIYNAIARLLNMPQKSGGGGVAGINNSQSVLLNEQAGIKANAAKNPSQLGYVQGITFQGADTNDKTQVAYQYGPNGTIIPGS